MFKKILLALAIITFSMPVIGEENVQNSPTKKAQTFFGLSKMQASLGAAAWTSLWVTLATLHQKGRNFEITKGWEKNIVLFSLVFLATHFVLSEPCPAGVDCNSMYDSSVGF